MHEQEPVVREFDDSPSHIESHNRGEKVLGMTKSNSADIIFFPEISSSEKIFEKAKKNRVFKKFITSLVISLTAATSATTFNSVAAKNNNDDVIIIEPQKPENAFPDIIKIDMDSDFAFKQTPEPVIIEPPAPLPTPTQVIEPVATIPNEVATTNEVVAQTPITPVPIFDGLDIAMRTAFSEGAYSSEEEARKIADVIINRAIKNGTSVGDEVAKQGQFQAYQDGINGKGNWGWREYGSGPQPNSIGTERVQQIFMEELNKAVLGQPLTHGYTSFSPSGDGKTNTFRW